MICPCVTSAAPEVGTWDALLQDCECQLAFQSSHFQIDSVLHNGAPSQGGALVLKQAAEVTNPDEIPFSFTCKNSLRLWIVVVIFSYTFNSGK